MFSYNMPDGNYCILYLNNGDIKYCGSIKRGKREGYGYEYYEDGG